MLFSMSPRSRALLQLAHDLAGDLRRSAADINGDGVLVGRRFLQARELAVEQANGHEVLVPRGHAPADKVRIDPHGELAGILALAADGKKPDRVRSGLEQIKMVAGKRNQRYLQALRTRIPRIARGLLMRSAALRRQRS